MKAERERMRKENLMRRKRKNKKQHRRKRA